MAVKEVFEPFLHDAEQSLLAQLVDNPPLENTVSQSTGLSDQNGEPPVDSSEAPGIAGDAAAPASAADDLQLNPNNTAADGLAAPTSTTDSSVDWQAKQRLITEQLHRVHYHPDRFVLSVATDVVRSVPRVCAKQLFCGKLYGDSSSHCDILWSIMYMDVIMDFAHPAQ